MTIPIHMIAGPLPMIRSMALFGLLIFERSNGLARDLGDKPDCW